MGEAGCGKTEMVRYLCHLLGWRLFILKLHGGIAPADVARVCEEAARVARRPGAFPSLALS